MTDAYVADAGVFLRWFVDQIGFEHARTVRREFLAGSVRLATTDSARVEYAHVLRRRGVLVGLIDRADYPGLVRLLDDLGVDVRPTDVDGLERAAALAAYRSLRFFDALVADLALQTGTPLLTSDKALRNAVGDLVEVELLRGV